MNPPKACECCEFEGAELKPYQPGLHGDDRTLYYCDLCAGTETSVRGHDGGPEVALMRAMCFIGNAVLVELRALNASQRHAEEQLAQLSQRL